MVVSLGESGGAYRVLRVGVDDFFACRKNGGWAPMPPRGGVHGVKVVASVGSDPPHDMRPDYEIPEPMTGVLTKWVAW